MLFFQYFLAEIFGENANGKLDKKPARLGSGCPPEQRHESGK
jgi:hypothetical protein